MVHSDFVHLHVHTQYSLLDGACTLERLIERAVEYKFPALAITDHGNLYGAIKFYNLCVKAGIKPIIGCEMYLAQGSRHTKEYKGVEGGNNHLLLLAKDDEGYRNLVKLSSLGHLEGFYYKPRIDKELLHQYNKGLIGLSACLKGEIASLIIENKTDKAYKAADEYLNIFGKGNFYLELMENGIPEQKKVNKALLEISEQLGIPVVATNDVHYLDKSDSFAHEVLLCIQTQTTLDDPHRFKFNSDTFYFRSPQEMKEIFSETPQALKNTLEVTQKCNLVFDFSKYHLPKFPMPQGESDDKTYLRKLVSAALPQRYPNPSDEIKRRLEYELSVIEKMGFASYFLIIWDLIKYAREHDVPVGPGRGSAAGSVVSYILRITDIDPLPYHLLFERFLNPARISMPDIDIDFCYEKRGRVIEYVSRKYGKDNVAQIITFGTMLARAVVRDVGRVMGISYTDVDKIAKMIPAVPGQHITLQEAIKTSSELGAVYKTDPNIKQLVDVAMRLEGLSRHASTHAAGVVISDKPLIERIPLVRGSEEEIVTGYDMNSLEKTGILKMDFLGLKTLTVIEETVKIIKRTKGKDLDIGALPLNDQKTYDLLARGETIGIFQLESQGMREILRKLVPTHFEDLIAVLALYRPGPLGSGMVENFIERKNGTKKAVYLHPRLEPILKETYGIILYQEQTMQIVSQLAGFSMAQADLLRKAIGKKIPEIMEEQRQKFVDGAKKNHISNEVAEKIFELIDFFSGYGFNKSHSTAYALISYRTAYLKANFPVEFMAALLTSERNNTDKVVEYVNESNRMGIKVLPPEINTSYANFTVTDDNNIRFGLLAIKNVGDTALESIVQVRKEKKFSDMYDFCERVDSRTVNKKVIESLIKSGAMDDFKLKRAQMVALAEKISGKGGKKDDSSQLTLFEVAQAKADVPDIEEWPLEQILSFEKSLLGIYLTSHPLYTYSHVVKYVPRQRISELYEMGSRDEVIVVGVVEKVRIITTRKKNEQMAIMKIEDETAGVDVFVFPRLYAETVMNLRAKSVLLLKAKLESKDKIPKLLAEKVIPVDKILDSATKVNIGVDMDKDKAHLAKLKSVFSRSPGTTPVVFLLKNSRMQGVKIKTGQDFCITPKEETLDQICEIVGKENLSLTL